MNKEKLIELMFAFSEKKHKEISESSDILMTEFEHKMFARGFEDGGKDAIYAMIDLLGPYELTPIRK